MKVFPLLCASYTSDAPKSVFVFKGDYLEI